jgi:hypothetical protein
MLVMIGRLLATIQKALLFLGQFLVVLALGILAAILLVLPWLLRLVILLLWLAGGYLNIQIIQKVYGSNTPAGPMLALQFVVIYLMVAWIGVLFQKVPSHTWGGLFLGGLLSVWIASQGIPLILTRWGYADLFIRSLPPALLAATMFYLTLRLRWLRSTQQLKLVNPAFLWLPKAVTWLKTISKRGNHE